MLLIALLACAEEESTIDESACETLESGDVHALSPSPEAGLLDGVAQFHLANHHHTLTLDGPAYIWADGAGETVTVQTNAEVVAVTHDGEAVELSEIGENSACPETLPTSFGLMTEEGTWEFEVDGSGDFDWLAIPSEGDGQEH